MPWNPFVRVTTVQNLRFTIGMTKRLDLGDTFSKVYGVTAYKEGTEKNISIEVRSVSPTMFDVVSSSRDSSDTGKEARFTILVFGTSKDRPEPVWKELMGSALSLLSQMAYRSSIVQCYAGLEAFLAVFVEEKLLSVFVNPKQAHPHFS
jgi:hypothetical protein